MLAAEGPGNQPDIAGMQAYAKELEERFWRMQEEGPKIQQRARALQVTEKSSDGFVTATVGPRGDLINLEIDPRIYRRPDARKLADTITETIKKAGTKAQEEVIELFAPIVSRETMRAHIDGDMDKITEQMQRQMRGER